jgi:dTDP-4-dehydrorhamnose 3,5-epimerase
MIFTETALRGAYLIKLEPFQDERGLLARTFCAKEFGEHGLKSNMVQSNLSVSYKQHTLRGMHYQIGGAEEAKLVRCTQGRILDVIIDIRPKSATFGRHLMVELDADQELQMLYVPEGFAHGFLTLQDNCQVFYQVSNFYSPKQERGIRWNDPFFGIPWPVTDPIISAKDANYPNYNII